MSRGEFGNKGKQKYLFSCNNVTYNSNDLVRAQVDQNEHEIRADRKRGRNRTISSLQIGQASWAPAAAGAADIDVSPFSSEMREVKSCVSAEYWEADA